MVSELQVEPREKWHKLGHNRPEPLVVTGNSEPGHEPPSKWKHFIRLLWENPPRYRNYHG